MLVLSIVATVPATGAPAAACADIYPVGHSGISQDLSTNLQLPSDLMKHMEENSTIYQDSSTPGVMSI